MYNGYGIQLYSVRDAMSKDVASTLENIAGLGYKYVEFAGFFGNSAEDIKKMLDDNGLICSGTHSSLDDLRPSKIFDTIKYHKIIKNPNYIIPYHDLSTLEKIEDFCSVVNFAKPILKAEGIELSYHNHSGEFKIMPWGGTIHSELERRTDIGFEIDTYWVYNAGLDPVKVLDKLIDRISVIHLKDGLPGGEGRTLGKGEAPCKAVIDYARAKGLLMVVESETLSPSGPDEAEACMEYLKSI